MKSLTYIVLAGLLVGLGTSAVAQQGHSNKGLNSLDKDYLKATAQSNLEEVQLAPVVASHATTGQAKQFGQRMKQDHALANASLKAVAAQVAFSLPTDISEDQKHIKARLAQLQGAQFAAAYKQEMIDDHTEDIARTQREISLGSDPRVIASARKNLALLQMHLKMSQALPGGGNTAFSA